MKKLMIFALAVFALLTAISCSKPDPLIGTWKNSILGIESSFTFNADKTFSASAFGKDIKGTWSRNSKVLKLVNSGGETSEMPLLLGENQFTITEEGQSTGVVFNRTPSTATGKTKAPDTIAPTPAPTPAKAEIPKDTIPWIKEGMFKVGTDLPADEYLICAKEGEPGYYQLTKDSSGELGSIISNDNFDSDRYLTVANGQYLTVTGAVLCSSKTLSLSPVDGKWNPGMYKVGRDIKAGEYKVIPVEGVTDSYVEVCRDSKNSLTSIISNDNFNAPRYITIRDGQYIKLNDCYMNAK